MTEPNFGLNNYLRTHNAIRRELERLEAKATRLHNPSSTELIKLQQWFEFYWDMLEQHHRNEDKMFFPLLAKIDPAFASRGPVLAFDHREIETIAEEVMAGFDRTINRQNINNSYRHLLGLLRLLREKLAAHLAREEAAFIPAILRNFTLPQQQELEENILKNTPGEYLAVVVPWTLQYVDDHEKQSALAELSARFRYLYNVSWQKRFERLTFSFSL